MPQRRWITAEEPVLWEAQDVLASRGFPFGVTTADPQAPHRLHSHHGFSEVVIVYRGEGVHFTEEEEYAVRAGDVFVVGGDRRHGFRDTRNLHLKNVCFEPRRMLLHTGLVKKLPGYHALFELEPRYRRAHCFESRLRLPPEKLRHLLGMVAEMERELEDEAPGYEYVALALFMQLVGYLCRCYGEGTHPTARSLLRMAEVISHLEAHYDEPIGLADLRDMTKLSNSALNKHFREATGLPPMEYLLRVRIARAMEQLRDDAVSITDAAFAVGFTDSNYFSRQFRRVMNTSPSAYRRRLRQGRHREA